MIAFLKVAGAVGNVKVGAALGAQAAAILFAKEPERKFEHPVRTRQFDKIDSVIGHKDKIVLVLVGEFIGDFGVELYGTGIFEFPAASAADGDAIGNKFAAERDEPGMVHDFTFYFGAAGDDVVGYSLGRKRYVKRYRIDNAVDQFFKFKHFLKHSRPVSRKSALFIIYLVKRFVNSFLKLFRT